MGTHRIKAVFCRFVPDYRGPPCFRPHRSGLRGPRAHVWGAGCRFRVPVVRVSLSSSIQNGAGRHSQEERRRRERNIDTSGWKPLHLLSTELSSHRGVLHRASAELRTPGPAPCSDHYWCSFVQARDSRHVQLMTSQYVRFILKGLPRLVMLKM